MAEENRVCRKNIRVRDDLYEAAAHAAKQVRPASTIRNVVEHALELYLNSMNENETYKTREQSDLKMVAEDPTTYGKKK
jgi:hypothetical protein